LKYRFFLALAATCALPAADLSYTQKTEITGGAMKQLAGIAGRFNRQAAGSQTTTHSFKGDRMAITQDRTAMIYDLKSEIITQIDNDKKEYSQITFAEMAAAMKGMASRMSPARGQKDAKDPNVEMKWKVSVETPGDTRTVAGVTGKHTIMKMQMDATDAKSGQGMSSEMITDSWIGEIPGYATVRDFQTRLAAKMFVPTAAQMMALGQGGSSALDAFREAGKKMAEFPGIPIYSIMRMGGPGTAEAMKNQPAGNASGGGPSAGEAGKEGAASAIGQSIGRLGGFGGFGRRKKQDEPAPAQQPLPQQQPAAGGGLLMEATTELLSFSSSVDASLFEIPAGYKQVEHPMKKMLKQN